MIKKDHNGFTLIELSIVLVIIGLIVGSAFVAHDLLNAAKLRAISKEANAYKVAFTTFYNKYNAIPGDMQNAGELFPDQTWYGGDNDGHIVWIAEGAEAWRQLAVAEMIPGIRNTTCNAPCVAIPGDTIPASQGFTNAGWTVMYSNSSQKNILLYGAQSDVDFMASTPVLTTQQARDIDLKLDDGKPTTGSIISKNTTGFSDCEVSYNYDLSQKDTVCNFSINLGIGK